MYQSNNRILIKFDLKFKHPVLINNHKITAVGVFVNTFVYLDNNHDITEISHPIGEMMLWSDNKAVDMPIDLACEDIFNDLLSVDEFYTLVKDRCWNEEFLKDSGIDILVM